jgi:hypothetical protein
MRPGLRLRAMLSKTPGVINPGPQINDPPQQLELALSSDAEERGWRADTVATQVTRFGGTRLLTTLSRWLAPARRDRYPTVRGPSIACSPPRSARTTMRTHRSSGEPWCSRSSDAEPAGDPPPRWHEPAHRLVPGRERGTRDS